jgi:tRNA pseudouridine38-40 synthase
MGTEYSGYQIQNGQITIQGELEDRLSVLLKKKVKTKGSSRTDTGVHALNNAFHFDFEGKLPDSFIKRMNALLPKDISFLGIQKVSDEFHARFSAIERSYVYKVYCEKNPFYNGRAYRLLGFIPDVEKMNKAAELLLKYEDFVCFSKANSGVKTTLCDIKFAKWGCINVDEFHFNIQANRFLRGMVRGIVGSLLRVGKGVQSLDGFEKMISTKRPYTADFSAPAEGLYLEKVMYKDINETL